MHPVKPLKDDAKTQPHKTSDKPRKPTLFARYVALMSKALVDPSKSWAMK